MQLSQAIEEANRDDVRLCVSLSTHPGTFGEQFHNPGYKALGLPFRYVACQINDITEALKFISSREANCIRGISIARPFKMQAFEALSYCETSAKIIGAVNTIVRQDMGGLTGYNTDFIGFNALIKEADIKTTDEVVILGHGGVAQAVLYSLGRTNHITVYATDTNKLKHVWDKWKVKCRDYFDPIPNGCTVINCTPIGGHRIPDFIDETRVAKYIHLKTLYEHEKRLLISNYKFLCYDGKTMSIVQASQQFKLYTQMEYPEEALYLVGRLNE